MSGYTQYKNDRGQKKRDHSKDSKVSNGTNQESQKEGRGRGKGRGRGGQGGP